MPYFPDHDDPPADQPEEDLVSIMHIGRDVIICLTIKHDPLRRAYVIRLNDDDEVGADPSIDVVIELAEMFMTGFMSGFEAREVRGPDLDTGKEAHVHLIPLSFMGSRRHHLKDRKN